MGNVIKDAIIEYERQKWLDPKSADPSTLRIYVDQAKQELEATDMSADAVHNTFGLYFILRDHEPRVNMLNGYLSRPLPVDEEAWARWNLVDGLALMRKSDELVPVHKAFLAWARQMLTPDDLFWVMIDCTQALTWFLGGYGDEWMSIFRELNESNPPSTNNRRLRCGLHNTASHALSRFERWEEVVVIADRLLSISQEDPSWESAFHFEMRAYICLVEAHGYAGDIVRQLHVAEKACSLLDKYANSLPDPSIWRETPPPIPDRLHPADVLGRRYEDLPQRDPVIWFRGTCHNLAAVLYRAKQYEMAIPLFERAMSYKFMSPYLARCYAASLWVVTKDKAKVLSFCDEVAPIFENKKDWWKSIPEFKELANDSEFIGQVMDSPKRVSEKSIQGPFA